MEPLFDFTMEEEEAGTASVASLNQLLRRSLVSRNKQTLLLRQPDGTTVFGCVECSQRYQDKEAMELHLITHNKEYRFICTICGTGLKRKEHLERHTLGHAGVRPHRCDLCGKAFKRKEHLNIHAAIHSGEKALACHLCERSFHRKDHLQKHMQSHSKRALEPEVRVRVAGAALHLAGAPGAPAGAAVKLEVDDDDVTPFITAVFGNADVAQLHDSYEESGDAAPAPAPDPARPHACPLCPKTFKRRDHLKLHSITHLKKDKICSQCGKGFPTDKTLLAHMNEHLINASLLDGSAWPASDALLDASGGAAPAPDPARPHACPLCPKTFKRRDHLKLHSITHLKKDKICSQCGKGFPTDERLLAHMSEHLSNASLLESGAWFDADADADADADESPAASQADAARRHACPHCDKRFKRRQHLAAHQRVHARLLSVWCSLCNEGFQSNEQFEQHRCSMSNAENVAEGAAGGGGGNLGGGGEDAGGDEPSEQPTDYGPYGGIPVRAASPRLVPVPARVYVCRYCAKQFRRRDHYRIHLNIHTGHKSFFCPHCGKGFYRKDHLQKHTLVHTKDKDKEKDRKRAPPSLVPIGLLRRPRAAVLPEITIHAPSSAKLRVPLQMKVPYEMVTTTARGERRALVEPGDRYS